MVCIQIAHAYWAWSASYKPHLLEILNRTRGRLYLARMFFLAVLAASLLVDSQGKQYTLNVPRVLLPYVPTSGIKSNFTLKSERGCFSWCVLAVAI